MKRTTMSLRRCGREAVPDPKPCRGCGTGTQVEILFPVYGFYALRIVCPACGRRTRLYGTTEIFSGSRSICTPVTWRGIRRALSEATAEWEATG